MKNDRQTAVLQIIEETAVETQEQLMQLLAVRGFACTQATVSRDIKQLHLMKAPDGKGGYRYAVSAQMPKLNFEEKLQTIFRECVVSAENAQNLAIIKTMNGMANAAGQHAGYGYRGYAGRRRHGAAGIPRQCPRGGFLRTGAANAALRREDRYAGAAAY